MSSSSGWSAVARIASEPLLGYALLALVGLHRALEVVVDARHARRLAERGGIVVPRAGTLVLIAFHLAWFAAVAVERLLGAQMFSREFVVPLALSLMVVEALRAWVLATLGGRWTMRVVVVPGEAPIACGPYRFASHPNYLVVIAELFLVPLLVGAWRTALVGSLLHLPVLAHRIRREEQAWEEIAGQRLVRERVPRRRRTEGSP